MAETRLVAWFNKHGNMVQGIAAIITALIALSALVGVKVQIDASAKTNIQRVVVGRLVVYVGRRKQIDVFHVGIQRAITRQIG